MYKKVKKKILYYIFFIFKKLKRLDYFIENGQIKSNQIDTFFDEKEKIKNRVLSPVITQPYKEKDLADYINKIFEQQEKERIVKWLVNSIRESLDLDKVLEKTVDEIGRLLKVDRCFIALYDKDLKNFYFHNEYRINDNIPVILDHLILELPKSWQEHLLKSNKPIVINNSEEDSLDEVQKNYLQINNIKSLIIIPIFHKNEILGAIMVNQVNYKREWENTHIEILKDTGSQIAIAIGQAILYSKVQEATKLKSEFLAGMSHELRTPLNAIIGFSEMLLSEDFGKLNKKQKKFMNNIFISGKHLLRLVNEVLDLSKVESGNMKLDYEEFNSNLAIFEAVSILKSMALKKNISIETNLEGNIIINADIVRFKQIMYNLISNAIKFTEDGGNILINSMFFDNNLKIEIIDTGIGILEENKDKVFQEFSRIDSSYSRKQDGTGLGLTLTKKLIEMHKGYIDFDSELGKGSRFWFILPEAKISEPANLQAG